MEFEPNTHFCCAKLAIKPKKDPSEYSKLSTKKAMMEVSNHLKQFLFETREKVCKKEACSRNETNKTRQLTNHPLELHKTRDKVWRTLLHSTPNWHWKKGWPMSLTRVKKLEKQTGECRNQAWKNSKCGQPAGIRESGVSEVNRGETLPHNWSAGQGSPTLQSCD